jgi:hypothetical protein
MRKSCGFVSLSRLSVLQSSRRTYTVLKSASFLPFFWAVERPLFSDIITRFARDISESLLLFLSSAFSTSSQRNTWHLKGRLAPQDIQPTYSWDRCQVFKNLEGQKITTVENKGQDYSNWQIGLFRNGESSKLVCRVFSIGSFKSPTLNFIINDTLSRHFIVEEMAWVRVVLMLSIRILQ